MFDLLNIRRLNRTNRHFDKVSHTKQVIQNISRRNHNSKIRHLLGHIRISLRILNINQGSNRIHTNTIRMQLMFQRMQNRNSRFITQLNRRTRHVHRYTNHTHNQRSMINNMIRIRTTIRTFNSHLTRQQGTRKQEVTIRHRQFNHFVRISRNINVILQTQRTQIARQVIRRILMTSFNTAHNHMFTRLTSCKFSTRRNLMNFISRKAASLSYYYVHLARPRETPLRAFLPPGDRTI